MVRSGVSAAREHRLEILAPGVFEAYVPEQQLQKLKRRYRLKPSPEPNVILHVINGRWPFDQNTDIAPRLAAILDLAEDPDERTSVAGLRALTTYDVDK